jgi:endonuclease/exonuclease/phosphatase family metal-dependent hydrolase
MENSKFYSSKNSNENLIENINENKSKNNNHNQKIENLELSNINKCSKNLLEKTKDKKIKPKKFVQDDTYVIKTQNEFDDEGNNLNEENNKTLNSKESSTKNLGITIEEKKTVTYYHELNDLVEPGKYSENTVKILPRKNNFRILTYNIFLRPPGVNNNGNDWKNERLDDFISIIHNYDIICLQELFGQWNNRKEYFLRKASQQGFFFFINTGTPLFTSKYVIDSGLLIISRFPIQLSGYHEFYWGVEIDSVVRKGVIYAKIQIKDCFLHLFTTHLQATYINSNEELFISCYDSRISQLYQVNEYITRVIEQCDFNRDKDKIIIVGDFNVDANNYKFKRPERDFDYNLVQKEYVDMMNIMNSNGLTTIDTFKTYLDIHPITYAAIDPEFGHTERCLTQKVDEEAQQSLDYIFELFYEDDPNENTSKLKLLSDSLKVESFRVASSELEHLDKKIDRKYSQLSDHYGLSCEIQYINYESTNEIIINNENNEYKQKN